MAVCDNYEWQMTLVRTKDSLEQKLRFKNIVIDKGELKGDVYNESGSTKLSALKGTCSATAEELVTVVTFDFSLPRNADRIGIFLAGYGFMPAGFPKAKFRGYFRAYTPDASTPVSNPESNQIVVVFDPGDTGTGSGMQT
jgi:hypothetical protein